MTAKVKLDRPAPGIAHLQLCDAEAKNSFTEALLKEFLTALDSLETDKTLNVLVLFGLPSVFCAGADLATLQQLGSQKMQPTDILLPKRLLDFPVPVIAAMEGHAVGGGLALGLCADIIILAEESRYGCSFMNMGFTPGMGTTRLLEHVMSPAIAHELLYTGELKKGKELIGKTNFNYIVPKTEVLALAFNLAERIAEKPNGALKLLKCCLTMERRKLFEQTYTLESMMHTICFSSGDILTDIETNYVR